MKNTIGLLREGKSKPGEKRTAITPSDAKLIVNWAHKLIVQSGVHPATGEEKRYCYAVGMDATGILKELPDFRNFDRTTPEVAISEIRDFDANGMTHSVWTFQTPFIGAVCNCDHDCMAYRVEYRSQLAKVMWKAEYVAAIEKDLCKGCMFCLKQCMFEAVDYSREQHKCFVNAIKCYGCGVCRTVCPEKAITLLPRKDMKLTANSW